MRIFWNIVALVFIAIQILSFKGGGYGPFDFHGAGGQITELRDLAAWWGSFSGHNFFVILGLIILLIANIYYFKLNRGVNTKQDSE
jgi:hypothetical protein